MVDQTLIKQGVDAYVRFFEALTPEMIGSLDTVVTEDVHFRDPFNNVHGRYEMRRVLEQMFKDIEAPRFVVTHRAIDGEVCFLRWQFTGRIRAMKKRDWQADGVTELRFNEHGLVSAHLDYWDAAEGFFEMIPILGGMIRFIRRRAAAR
ncbi:MAG: nuclear transport factor 2 family protein [Proteobacteria bacterium]|nr:nuclear transport factor 2 family protein [Pseudomonadota bacterium]